MKLNEKFNNDQFIDWIEELLPSFERNIKTVDFPEGFQDVTKIDTLGESEIGVRIFVVEMTSDPTRRRISVAKDSFNLLKKYSVQNALVAYHSKNHTQWRLSLLTSSAVWENGKVVSKLSNLKRQSFILGEKAKIKTPTKCLSEKVIDLIDLKKRFSIEVVNKDFYKEISKAFNALQSVLKMPSKEERSHTNLEFSVRLIGRIIFCWFLREKKSENGVSLISDEILSLNSVKTNKDYYHKVLEPLFFEILNKSVRREEFDKEPFSKTPYLNGGLFSAQYDDFYERGRDDFQSKFHNTLVISDSWFESLFETLETYNFTIDENTSFDEELSIDPEMLGRIFENLLAEINPETGESARKSTGSYYTPRVIVDYMVDESILLYLRNKTKISEEKLRAIVSYDLDDDESNPITDDEKEKIIDALGKIKILDPACGSGAFPMGALQKIVFILQQIDPQAKFMYESDIKKTLPEYRKHIQEEYAAGNFDYLRKLRVIRESIYGVDIQPIATEISRLRCFLTLVVDQQIRDERPDRGIKPLPNLDFKFVTANSLICLPKSNDLFGELEDEEGIDKLSDIRAQYFNSSGVERSESVSNFYKTQRDIDHRLEKNKSQMYADRSNALRMWNPFDHSLTPWFDPEWMFGIKKGFDIVIANPPYIQLSKIGISKEFKQYLIEKYKTSSGRFNTFGFFIIFGLDLVTDQGVLTYIIPNTLLSQEYYQYIRKYILDKSCINEIVNYNDMVFGSAVVENITIFLSKVGGLKNHLSTKISNQTENGVELIKRIDQNNFHATYKNQFDIKGDSITNKIELLPNSEKLSDLCNINQAIALKSDRSKSLLADPKLGDEVYKLLDGRNIQRYKINWTGVYLDYDLKKIHSCKRKDIFLKDEKLLFRRVSSNLIFAYDNNQFFALNTLVVVTVKDKYFNKYSLKYLLSILNSKLINYYYFHKYKSTKNVFSEIQARSVGLIPIPLVSLSAQQEFITAVDKILSTDQDANIKEYDYQINRMVYKLYGLTEEEITIIEK